ncbi:MAG: L-aspartate oxidase [bacterium]|nr:L-aspartate oxidase [bacterium]
MKTDTLIIGCGIAGAAAALELAEDRQRQITLVTRTDDAVDSNSSRAQGGVVGRGVDDTPERLAEDVLAAGAGLSRPNAVDVLCEQGPQMLKEILVQRAGVVFDHDDEGRLLFGLEGAHSERRIVHVGDTTGRAIMDALLRAVAERSNIRVLTRRTAVDLITFPHHSRRPTAIYERPVCHGAYLLDQTSGEVEPIVARNTILATGGAGQVYMNTSNRPGARGDGLAMATRAGVRLVNMEYVQFHPTTLHMAGVTKFLISEAVRGEGGVLLTPDGRRFMEQHEPQRLELAARDIVARAIYWEMLEHDYPHVLLDIASHKPADFVRGRFSEIHRVCLDQGLDITSQPIPVVPAAHYLCGGVLVDLDGRSSLDRLYAVGETSCTGVHGANRLASTSLLEGLVWGTRAARDIRRQQDDGPLDDGEVPAWDVSDLEFEPDPALIQGDMQTIRNLMWHYVGLVRSAHRLNRAVRELNHLRLNIEDFYNRGRLSDGLIGLRNAVQTALVITHSARRNRTSRGCHFRDDARSIQGGAPPVEGDALDGVGGPANS